jgi:hypothetical protein
MAPDAATMRPPDVMKAKAATGKELQELKVKLARGGSTPKGAAGDDIDTLKAKLAEHAPGPEREEWTPATDTDLLRAKRSTESAPPKTERLTSADSGVLTKKLRTKQDLAPESGEGAPGRSRELQATGPALLAVPTPRSAPAVRRQPQADECSIRWWRGYVRSEFYAVSGEGEGTVIAESPFFWWGRTDPPDSEAAVAAHQQLIAELEQSGWTIAGRGRLWFELRLRRVPAPTVRRRAEARRHDREEHHA